MQVYKYCQCKNGTQKINADHNDDTTKPDDRYTYIVDCNRKRVYPASSYVETGSTPTTTFDDANDNDRTNIWTIFNTNSATSGSQQPTFICMFVLIYFYYLFFWSYDVYKEKFFNLFFFFLKKMIFIYFLCSTTCIYLFT